jgi:hypothetical protein
MGLPSTGELSFSAIRTELGKSGAIDLNNSSVRGLAGKASGAISFSDLIGKSNSFSISSSFGIGCSHVSINTYESPLVSCHSISASVDNNQIFYPSGVANNAPSHTALLKLEVLDSSNNVLSVTNISPLNIYGYKPGGTTEAWGAQGVVSVNANFSVMTSVKIRVTTLGAVSITNSSGIKKAAILGFLNNCCYFSYSGTSY